MALTNEGKRRKLSKRQLALCISAGVFGVLLLGCAAAPFFGEVNLPLSGGRHATIGATLAMPADQGGPNGFSRDLNVYDSGYLVDAYSVRAGPLVYGWEIRTPAP
jgi:hypothetical protein